jgi:hypothetical protein
MLGELDDIEYGEARLIHGHIVAVDNGGAHGAAVGTRTVMRTTGNAGCVCRSRPWEIER